MIGTTCQGLWILQTIVSRGLTPSVLTVDQSWLCGPHFLWGPEHSWQNQERTTVLCEDLELKKETHVHSLELNPDSVVAKKGNSKFEPIKDRVDDPFQVLVTTCSDWTRLRRKVAWLLRFTQFIKDKGKVQTGRLTVDDLNAATLAITRIVQGSAYAQEIKDLKSNGAIKTLSEISALTPELDAQGVLRVNGHGQLSVSEST